MLSTAAAVKEANIPTFIDLLPKILAHPGVVERMRSSQTPGDELLRLAVGFLAQVGIAIQWVRQSPSSPGYEPWLTKHSVDPVFARAMALMVVRRGNRVADESKRLSAVVSAIRFLAKPGRHRRAIPNRVGVLLAAWEETSVIEEMFSDAGLDESELVLLLKSAAQGNDCAYSRLTEVAASLLPHLPIRRGPKISAASAAHEFFLEEVVLPRGPHAYTWSPNEEKCTDPLTQATRQEFGCPDFDPRPAYRRLKARQKPKSN
jgi:hypothetical protein